jgi:hypothetical protein
MSEWWSGLAEAGIFVIIAGVQATYLVRGRSEARFIDAREELLLATLPSGKVLRLPWSDLREVSIVTTGVDLYFEDVFWEIVGPRGVRVRVPQSIPGTDLLLSRFQRLPGFDSGADCDAMTSTKAARFRCWTAREKTP